MKKLVIIPGGYHPYHAGHKSLYDAAREAFPSADVFVAATADTSTRPFPFAVKKFLAQQAGVPGNRFIQVKSPFRAEEITQMYDPTDTQLIFVRSEKDLDSQPRAGGVKKDGSPSYLQPYKRAGRETFDRHAYMAYLPVTTFGPGMTSATEIRAKWPEMTSEQKIALIKTLYPSTSGKDSAAAKIVDIFDETIGSTMDESLGRALATGALAGAMTMASPAEAQNLEGYNTGYLQKIVTTGQPHRGITPQQAMKELRGRVGSPDSHTEPPSAEFEKRYLAKKIKARDVDEATIVNDPDAGVQIQPEGGMGTWDEQSLVTNLARKFASMVEMVRNKNYGSLHHALYRAGVVENMVRALAELEQFQKTQGRRPMARGREIDITDYLDEKI